MARRRKPRGRPAPTAAGEGAGSEPRVDVWRSCGACGLLERWIVAYTLAAAIEAAPASCPRCGEPLGSVPDDQAPRPGTARPR